ncbi:MAG: GTPase Era [Bryobacteraceae bacterium]
MSENRPVSGFVSGFVSILGRPNAGKSTLLNAMVGDKLAIVSNKPQTTRGLVQGVVTMERAQMAFLDTPGVHESPRLLHRRMMAAVREALEGRDLLLWVADATRPFAQEDRESLAVLAGNPAPCLLVLNKIDALRDKGALLPLIAQFGEAREFRESALVSAKTGEGLDELKELIAGTLPEGPRYFPEDHITDQPERHLAAEFIREEALEATAQEVPHAVAVLIDQWDEGGPVTRIAATIVVERQGQKKIVIGAGGAMLKRIGSGARAQIERMLGRRVYLELFVKVRKDWRENPGFLNELDWRLQMGGEAAGPRAIDWPVEAEVEESGE